MADQTRKPKPKQEEASEEAAETKTTDEKTEEVDDLLDEIDSVLESNAEEFVRSVSSKRAESDRNRFSSLHAHLKGGGRRRRMLWTAELPASPTHLTCAKCGQAKPITEFPRNKREQDRTTIVTANLATTIAATDSSSNDMAESSTVTTIDGAMALGADEVDELIREQGGLCAVCRIREAKQVDHDHETGGVRGIVCLLCNAAMGAFHDDPNLIRRGNRLREGAREND